MDAPGGGVAYWAEAGAPSEDVCFNFFGSGQGKMVNENTIMSYADVIAFYSSDQRWKKNVKVIEHPLDKIKKIRGVKFNWKDNAPSWTRDERIGNPSGSMEDIGVIAQEVKKVLPEIVRERKDGYLAVDYKKITALLIEGIKDQQKQIEELEIRISNMENR
jgi:hypothetical protein